MRRLTKYVYVVKYSSVLAMLATALLIFVCVPGIHGYEEEKSNMISVFVNGVQVGIVKDSSGVDDMVLAARKRIAKESSELVLVDINVVLSGSKDVVGQVDDRATIINNIYAVLKDNIMKTKQPVYEVKINDFTVNLANISDVLKLLEAAKALYDIDDEWQVSIITDSDRELDVYTTSIERKEEDTDLSRNIMFPEAGAFFQIREMYYNSYLRDANKPIRFGVLNIDFDENVEIVKAYVDADKIANVDDAIEAITKTQEKSRMYEVVSGDTLSGVAYKNDMSVKDLMALNPSRITSEDVMLRIGEELTIYSPEPELSIIRTERRYYEENYEEDVIYRDNDEWYTNRSEVIQEPQVGHRRVVADLSYRNAELVGTNILFEKVDKKAVAKIVVRGTKAPPTYIYPVSGRISSSFGKRKAPKKGASTFHKGIDFAVPTGTAVMASCGGTVIRAGWGSGYGYCVYIEHPDGRVTRYGHLSKVLVKAGQSVSQGQKIALSGNTGISTGPHLHFEILIGGGQVNPLNYIQ